MENYFFQTTFLSEPLYFWSVSSVLLKPGCAHCLRPWGTVTSAVLTWSGLQSGMGISLCWGFFFLITVSSIPIFSVLAPNCTSDNSAHFSYYFWTNKIYVALELKTVLNSQNFGKEHCRKEERDGPAFPLLDSLSCNEGGKTDFWNCIQQLY